MAPLRVGTGGALLTSLAILISQHASAEFIAALSPCPMPCSWTGPDPSKWADYHTKDALDYCNQTTIFQMNLYNPIDDPDTQISYRACSTANDAAEIVSLSKRQTLSLNRTVVRGGDVTLQSVSWGASATGSGVNMAASMAITQLGSYLKTNQHLTNDALFSRSGKVVAGIYSGAQISGDDAADIVQRFVDKLGTTALPARQAIQLCGMQNRTIGTQVFGLVVDTNGDVAAVQSALRSWHNATCVSGDNSAPWQKVPLELIPGTDIKIEPSNTDDGKVRRSDLEARATCKYIQAQSGDGCWSLAQRCGITEDQLKSYNGGSSFCGSIKVGAYVCCSAGSKPDFSPKPGSDGSCYKYTVKTGDTCDSIASSNQMLKDDGSPNIDVIETYNKNTWAWSGCRRLLIGEYICLSSGSPPFPANLPTALCGPQVNNTTPTSDQSSWEKLNPCSLNACCNVWGQCGITPDFCNAKRGPTGAPGTAPPGENGCISNCGTQIVASPPPAKFERVGYYENFGLARPCLNMPPSQIPSTYTIVHWAFANITSDFAIDISGYKENFQQFMAMKGFKKVVSFGGWAFSTEPATYNIFRQAVTPGNRQKFVNSLVAFVKQYGVDGIDFDWEYPGEPDIPGIPPGQASEGPDYAATVELLKASMPSGTTVSVVVPASYWYLRPFPMNRIGRVADYIIFMTYDLHGQWDHGNRWGSAGCPAGNCLRSQTNTTETVDSISMLSKAGVPLNKVVFGQPLYGRTFQMTQAGCWQEQCTYTGPESGAKKGKCTGTGGYMANWEIQQIIADPSRNPVQYSTPQAGDILVYDSTQWVSWTSPSTYKNRTEWARGLNFMGTADWAIDLDSNSGGGGDGGGGGGVVYVPPSIYTQPKPLVQCEPPCLFVFPPWTLATPTTIVPPPYTITVDDVASRITTPSGGVTSTVYVTATTVLTIKVPPVTTTEIPVWNVPWTRTDQSTILLTTSIDLAPVTVNIPSHVIVTSGVTVNAPATVVTFNPGPYPPYNGPPPGAPVITTVVTGQDGKPTTSSVTGPFPKTTVVTQSDGKSSTTTIVPIVSTAVTTNPQGQTTTKTVTQGLVTQTTQGGTSTTPLPPPPPPGSVSGVVVTSGRPTQSSTPGGDDNGTLCRVNCIPEPPCIGTCGCIGICPDDCLSNIPSGCGSGGGGGGRPGPGKPPSRPCTSKSTVSRCAVACPARTQTTSCRTRCAGLVGCGHTGTTTTVFGTPTGFPAPGHEGAIDDLSRRTTEDAADTAMWGRASARATSLLSKWFKPTPSLVFDIYADAACKTSQGQATLTKGACVKPTPAWGFSAVRLAGKKGVPDGKKVEVSVFSLERCQRNSLHFDYRNTTAEMGGCLNRFGQPQTTCNDEHRDDCFVATSMTWYGVEE